MKADEAAARRDWRWIAFGKLLPGATFGLLAGANAELVLSDAGDIAALDASRMGVIAGRLLTMMIPLAILIAYLVRRPASRSDRAPLAALLAVTGAVLPVAIPVVQHALGLPGTPPSPATILGANLLLGASSMFALWALACLRTSFSILPEARNLRTAGPYGIVRHPLYIAEIAAACGTAMLLGSPWVWLAVAAFAAVQFGRALREERVLVATLAGYADYRRATGMLLPRIRARA